METHLWYILVLAAIVLVLIIYSIIKLVQNNWIGLLRDKLKKSIQEAEESGQEGYIKKQYVIEKIQEYCKEVKIPFKLIVNVISKLIDQIISYYNIVKK